MLNFKKISNNKKLYYYLFSVCFVLFSLLFSNITFAQTKIKGTIINNINKKNVPYASVVFKGTTIGTVTDFEGTFFLETREKVDTLIFSCIGYTSDTIKIRVNSFQELNIYLEPQSYNIEEIVVNAGENPAHILLRKIIKHKKYNNYKKFSSYRYEQYTKMEFDVNNFSSKIQNEKALSELSILFESIDTSAVSGKIYMPLMISETLSDFYYKKKPKPKRQKEVIKAVKISGVQNESISRLSGQMYSEINFYENYVDFIEIQFISPIAVGALLVYEYYLTDSALIDDDWCYNMTFKARRKHETTFRGNMWIVDSTFAIKKISARMSKNVNINYVNDMYVKQEFVSLDDSLYFPAKEELFVDLNIANKSMGFFGKKKVLRKNIELNVEHPPKFFSKTVPREILILENSGSKDTAFWNNERYEKLTEKEKKIYTTIDSIQNIKLFRNVKNFVVMLATGYVPIGDNFEFGPYYGIYSKNNTEGSRFQLGGRTSNMFSKKFEFSGLVAFGLKDEKLKYQLGTKLKLDDKPWTIAKISYKSDLVQLGLSKGAFSENNIMSSFLSRSSSNSLILIKDFNIGIKKDWFKGFHNNLVFSNKVFQPSESVKFVNSKNEEQSQLIISEISFTTHIGFNEEYIEGVFNRVSLGSIYPIFDLEFIYGFPNFTDDGYEYKKLIFSFQHRLYLGPIGKFKYKFEAGKIFGTVPFPLLKLHEGNQTYMYDYYAFNLMNYYEFASDEYVSGFIEHHFNGLFLNKIPLLRKAKPREVIFIKGVVGSLNPKNRDELLFPGSLSDVRKPYVECGVAISNIFTLFRVDAIWRLTHLDKPNINKFGIFVSMQVSF